jgi:hypothetical protein
MIKVISAVTVSAFIAGALFLLPGFAPPLEAQPAALQKGDRLLSRAVAADCAKQMWPNFSTDCLHGKGEKHAVRRIPARG